MVHAVVVRTHPTIQMSRSQVPHAFARINVALNVVAVTRVIDCDVVLMEACTVSHRRPQDISS